MFETRTQSIISTVADNLAAESGGVIPSPAAVLEALGNLASVEASLIVEAFSSSGFQRARQGIEAVLLGKLVKQRRADRIEVEVEIAKPRIVVGDNCRLPDFRARRHAAGRRCDLVCKCTETETNGHVRLQPRHPMDETMVLRMAAE